jgi:hypothetical protein
VPKEPLLGWVPALPFGSTEFPEFGILGVSVFCPGVSELTGGVLFSSFCVVGGVGLLLPGLSEVPLGACVSPFLEGSVVVAGVGEGFGVELLAGEVAEVGSVAGVEPLGRVPVSVGGVYFS